NIVELEEKLKSMKPEELDGKTLESCKGKGLSDEAIANFLGMKPVDVHRNREALGIKPVFRVVDTCAAEFEAVSSYYYSSYGWENEVIFSPGSKGKIVVIGSGPIRIGQGIEFDYCSVHCIMTLKKLGYEAVIINNNPETVSTDYDISDRLYFEPLTPEYLLNILDIEKPEGAIVQFGGQSAIKLAKTVHQSGYKILGTGFEAINMAEDREEFDDILGKLGISRPAGHTVFTVEEAAEAAGRLGYPVLVRPSYVLGGQGMEIAYNREDMVEYINIVNRVKQEHPVLIDKYIPGREIEVDAVCDGKDILIPGIMEHIERAGIHSGDSISVYPAPGLPENVTRQVEEWTARIVE
ncbi:MAG TPA: carbamoyl-phosphate synthase large subunit, partial [Bacillota bacterium]|nr:carbamoyl-phosphate synthase large subunit [Bacillota bacterium]